MFLSEFISTRDVRQARRLAVERGNGQLKIFWAAADGNTCGACRFHAQSGAVVVHLGWAALLASAPY
jgi:hypothetical protein